MTTWTAGGPPGPPQWLEVDLEQPATIGAVAIPIGFVTPGGPATIEVWGRGPDPGDSDTLLHTFSATLGVGDLLQRSFDPPLERIRHVRFEVTDMAGWVILHEVQVLRP